MANTAILPDHFPVRTQVLAVVATETAIGIEMAEIVGMGLPIQFHLRKSCPAEDLLHLIDRIADFNLPGFGKVGILVLVEAMNLLRNPLYRPVKALRASWASSNYLYDRTITRIVTPTAAGQISSESL
jgi:hypothetical protein